MNLDSLELKCLDVVTMASPFSGGEVSNNVQKLHLSFKTARMRGLWMADHVSLKEIKQWELLLTILPVLCWKEISLSFAHFVSQ